MKIKSIYQNRNTTVPVNFVNLIMTSTVLYVMSIIAPVVIVLSLLELLDVALLQQ